MTIKIRLLEFVVGAISGVTRKLYRAARLANTQMRHTTEDVATLMEYATALTQSDIVAVIKALVVQMRVLLRRGDRVFIEGLGTFFMTINSESSENPEDISARSITRVNIRFIPDRGLRLMNAANPTTRGGIPISFEMVHVSDDGKVLPDDSENGDDENGDYIDPEA